MTARRRIVLYLRAVFGMDPPRAYVDGFEDGLRTASAIVGYDLRQHLPRA